MQAKEACKPGIHPGFGTNRKTSSEVQKQGYQWPHKGTDVLQKFLKKETMT